jgi:hypothetical protein
MLERTRSFRNGSSKRCLPATALCSSATGTHGVERQRHKWRGDPLFSEQLFGKIQKLETDFYPLTICCNPCDNFEKTTEFQRFLISMLSGGLSSPTISLKKLPRSERRRSPVEGGVWGVGCGRLQGVWRQEAAAGTVTPTQAVRVAKRWPVRCCWCER